MIGLQTHFSNIVARSLWERRHNFSLIAYRTGEAYPTELSLQEELGVELNISCQQHYRPHCIVTHSEGRGIERHGLESRINVIGSSDSVRGQE